MRAKAALAAAVMIAATACVSSGAEERALLVDFSHDEFTSSTLLNFPEKVTVRQGTTLVFRQTWTGEPHTITGGSLVDEKLDDFVLWAEFFEAFDEMAGSGAPLPNPDDPGDATFSDFVAAIQGDDGAEFRAAYEAVRQAGSPLPPLDEPSDTSWADLVQLVQEESELEGLPWALDEDEAGLLITQNAGQPCYLTEGGPPEDLNQACAEENQVQPNFDGSHSYYNSGIIPYEGPGGNTFRVPLEDDLDPGTYVFYCAVHGPGQRTEVEVVEANAEAPSQEEINRAARREIDEATAAAVELFREASENGVIEVDGEQVEGPFAGIYSSGLRDVLINQFVPSEISVDGGEPITWTILGAPHSISFEVPEYFPIMEFADDGTVSLNPRLFPPAGGAPDLPGPDEPLEALDGGTYDGDGFWSSGLIEPYAGPVEYTLRISEPGTYRFACLLHPPMTGTIRVT